MINALQIETGATASGAGAVLVLTVGKALSASKIIMSTGNLSLKRETLNTLNT